MVNNNKKRDVGTKQSTAYIKKLIVEEAIKQGVPPELALAVAAHESYSIWDRNAKKWLS